MRRSRKMILLVYCLIVLICSYFIYNQLRVKSVVRAFGPLTFTFPSSSLFNEENWFPGKSVTKIVLVENTDNFPQIVAIKSANSLNGLADSILVEISVNGSPIYQKSLSEFFNERSINLFTLDGQERQSFDITLRMRQDAGDEFQGKTASFDLVGGAETTSFERIPTIRPFPTINTIQIIPSIPQIRLRNNP